MKNKRLIIVAFIPFLFSCSVSAAPSSSEVYSKGFASEQYNSESFASPAGEDAQIVSSNGISSSTDGGDDCGRIINRTSYWGFALGHSYNMTEKPVITVGYARWIEGNYHLTLLPNADFASEGIRLCTDYFSKADVVRCYPNGDGQTIPSAYKTFSYDFDLSILTTLGTNRFALTVCDDGGRCASEYRDLYYFIESDGCIRFKEL